MSDTHFQISRKIGITIVTALIVVIASMVVWLYERETDTTYQAIQTNQKAIQKTNELAQENHTEIAVIKERVSGHKKDNNVHN